MTTTDIAYWRERERVVRTLLDRCDDDATRAELTGALAVVRRAIARRVRATQDGAGGAQIH